MYTITDDEREEQHVDWIWKRIGGEPSRSECRKLRPTASVVLYPDLRAL